MKALHALLLSLCLLPSVARTELVNGIYVVVNDSVITLQEVEMQIAPLVELLLRQYGNQPAVFDQRLQQTRSEKIEELVTRELILHEFKTKGYNLPESFVDDAIKEDIQQKFGDRVTLTKTLQAQGVTYETYRRQQKEDFIIRALISRHVSPDKIIVSPEKIEKYYQANKDQFKLDDQVKLRMIAINKTANRSAEQARSLAEEILKKLNEGAAFAGMASIYSDGSSRNQGGDRGWVDRTTFKKEISDLAFSLQPGRVSDILDLPEACYLLLVEEAKTAHTRDLQAVKTEIEQKLKAEERARLQKKWIDRLKSNSFVRYY